MNRFHSRGEIHRTIYLFALALLVCCLPLSRYILSISVFLMALNWIAEGHFRHKLSVVRNNKYLLLFISVFVLYAIGFLYSENQLIALQKVKNALPLLALPLIVSTSHCLDKITIKRLLLLYSAAVITAAIICVIFYFFKDSPAGSDYREISVFMPHIRFAFLVDMALAVLMYYAFTQQHSRKGTLIIEAAGILFLSGFLFFLRSGTGILIFILIIPVFLMNIVLRSDNKQAKFGVITAIVLIFLSSVLYVVSIRNKNFTTEPADLAKLELYTANGNPYVHDMGNTLLENGNFIGIYVCEKELRKEWERRSKLPYGSIDKRGQAVDATLKRYLTSKGLRKDSAGLHDLTVNDISKIEAGIANYKFSEAPDIRQRLYETLWEIDVFRKTGYVQQHTIGQRLAFNHLALILIKQNLWFGTGTGDVYHDMHELAAGKHITFDPDWEGKPHNQFLFMGLAFGLSGLLWIIFCWLFPVIRLKTYKSLLFNQFAIIVFISMFAVDTLESYDSMMFFAFFYSLFVFGRKTTP